MNFLKTLFWVVATTVVVAFSFNNWKPFEVTLWGPLVADTHVPVLMVGSFLLGFIPMPILHRARMWSLRRRLATLESPVAAVAPAAEPPAEPVVLRR